MNKTSTLILALAASTAVFAQQGGSEADMLKSAYNSVKANLTKAAEAMPEEGYSFKPTPQIRTFAEEMAHVTDVQARICSAAAGSEAPPSAAKMTAKADLVGALQKSFEVCDGVFNSLSDADASKTMNMGRGGARSEFGTLWTFIIGHSNEQYGYMAVYLRLKGVVPPSSAGRGR